MYRNTGSRMPSVGTGSIDIRSILSNIVNVVKSKANVVCTAPCDGAVLKMHYRWTFMVLIGSFFTVWYQWYNRDVITCVSHFNAENQVRMDYINICLSYPYVLVDEKSENPTKRYLLFYRWVQWSFLLMAAVYYIPRKMSKNMENPKCKKLLEEFSVNASRYDPQAEQTLMEKVTMYMKINIRTHNGLYVKYLTLNIVALIIDLFTIHYFDFLLQGKFLRYGFDAYPFERDPEYFTDYMSQMFPPFALCTLDRDNQLVNKRTETFGCHLTIMELYEKVFLFLWVWLILLAFMTALYILMMFIVLIPKVRLVWLRTSKPPNAPEKVNVILGRANLNCKIGDLYFLYRLKSHMSHARFYELLFRLGDEKLSANKNKSLDGLEEHPSTVIDQRHPPNKPQHNSNMNNHNEARNRKPQPQSNNPPINPEYFNSMYKNPENLARHGQVGDMAQKTPLLNNKNNANTSILIE